jgi:hypothetical protein
MFTANFVIPNEGIERMARKNDGASANPKQIRTDVDCRAARPKLETARGAPPRFPTPKSTLRSGTSPARTRIGR